MNLNTKYGNLNDYVVTLQHLLDDGKDINDTNEFYEILYPFFGQLEGGNIISKMDNELWQFDRDSTKLSEYHYKSMPYLIRNHDPKQSDFITFAKKSLKRATSKVMTEKKTKIQTYPIDQIPEIDQPYYTDPNYDQEIDSEEINFLIRKSLALVKDKDRERTRYLWDLLIWWLYREITMDFDGHYHYVLIDDEVAFMHKDINKVNKEFTRIENLHFNQSQAASEMTKQGFGSKESNLKFIQRFFQKCHDEIFTELKPNTTYNKNRKKRLGQRGKFTQNQWEKAHAEKYSSLFFDSRQAQKNKEHKKKYNDFIKEQPIEVYHISEIK
ncbi:hypothetical protein SAMN05444392_102248 [Seinonella peptonophila]|uniref:Uncharacterized protein n=1 Tax=Seinonella peptonophila TaxID=112248 RepID=A0A1M4V9W7_9BACL|nr:hypothetical protein [Seinonella peptonophila]SHE65628.1 hypothetical protein SAMN05444392_102248 [Seinonella peptonophila]